MNPHLTRIPMIYRICLFFACLLAITGCQDTDLYLATEAGIDAVQAITLSDRDVHRLAQEAARLTDSKNRLAAPASDYAGRLERLAGRHLEADDYGAAFLQQHAYGPEHAVSALRKLATLGNDHSFLASHPAPGDRADRLEKGVPIPAETSSFLEKSLIRLKLFISSLYEHMKAFLSGVGF